MIPALVHGKRVADCRNDVGSSPTVLYFDSYIPRIAEEPHRKGYEEYAAHQRVEHLLTGIKLQMLLVSGADAGDADEQEGGHLTEDKVPILVYHPLLDTAMDV